MIIFWESVWYLVFGIWCLSLITQLSVFSVREMNNPLALCELAARAPNISAGHIIKQARLLNDHVFILLFKRHRRDK